MGSQPPPRVTVDSLPEEIIAEVMHIDTDIRGHFDGPPAFEDADESDGDLYDAEKKLIYSAVSRRWRHIALSNAPLWARFRFGQREADSAPHTVDIHLDRSRAAPLDIVLAMAGAEPGWEHNYRKITHPMRDHAARALVPHAGRIWRLRVTLRHARDALRELLCAGVSFPSLRELRIARQTERYDFSSFDFTAQDALVLSLSAPALVTLELDHVGPGSWAQLLTPTIETLRITGHKHYNTDPGQYYWRPEETMQFLGEILDACPALRTLALEADSSRLLGLQPSDFGKYSLRSLRSLTLKFNYQDVIAILQSLSHVFIPEIKVVVEGRVVDPDASDSAKEPAPDPLVVALLRGMGPIVEFDIHTFYTVTLRDASGNARTMGTDETLFSDSGETWGFWDHVSLWKFLSRTQKLHERVREITLDNRSWLAWAKICAAAGDDIELDELRIVDGAWEYIDTSPWADDDETRIKYEYWDSHVDGEMQPLRFARLDKIELDSDYRRTRRPSEVREQLEIMFSYIKTPPAPVCRCDARIPKDFGEIELEETTWVFCDRLCYPE